MWATPTSIRGSALRYRCKTRYSPSLRCIVCASCLELGARRQTLPAYLGSTVRGIFAASFRQVVCVTRAPVCDGCLLLHRCPYPYIFETPPALHLPEVLQKRFRQAPRPYIFEVPLIYRGEETLELGLVLVGRALDFLPYFLYVVQETGKSGLGRARVPYRLLTVTDGSRLRRPGDLPG